MTMNIGMNVAGLNVYTPDWPFVDVMRHSKRWLTPTSQDGSFKTNGNGWITSLAPEQSAVLDIYLGAKGHYPAGTYTCFYTGSGTLRLSGNAFLKTASPGKITFDVIPTNRGISLTLSNTDPTNFVRNIRIIMPGFESSYQTEPFHPLFLNRLKPFSTIRFMCWSVVNNCGPSQGIWNKRTKSTFYTQTDSGSGRAVAVEHMIHLCNTLSKDMWINIPHTANDSYVTNLALLIYQQLKKTLKVYVEFSNEAWNTSFSQSQDMSNLGLQMNFSINPLQAALHYYAFRSTQVFELFRQSFPSIDRVACVLSSQELTWTLNQISTFQEAYKSADALAVAPYFFIPPALFKDGTITKDSTIDQILDIAEQNMVERMNRLVKPDIALAQSLGKPLLAYEGGQSLVAPLNHPDVDVLTELFIQANRSERMGEIYTHQLQLWDQFGGGLFMAFAYVNPSDKYGMWGVLEYQDQPLNQAPKYQALTS